MAEGDPNYYGVTLHNYGSLVTQIRRQFEMMVPEMFRKVRRLEDGEDIDIDDVIEAIVDIKTGSTPSDKFYWRRNKVQRDVAAAFLLDTSASTAEAIDEGKKAPDSWDAPDDPVEYMVWLRSRRGEAMRRSYKRIIDVEKEALVLIVNALEAIGDIYGIYGFSGYGRENVEFYTIKELHENFSDRVKKRIDRIAPLHATRMGPAIRHATSKLESQDARTKLPIPDQRRTASGTGDTAARAWRRSTRSTTPKWRWMRPSAKTSAPFASLWIETAMTIFRRCVRTSATR